MGQGNKKGTHECCEGEYSAELNFGRGRPARFLNLFRQWVLQVLFSFLLNMRQATARSHPVAAACKGHKKERKGSLCSYLFDLSFSDFLVFPLYCNIIKCFRKIGFFSLSGKNRAQLHPKKERKRYVPPPSDRSHTLTSLPRIIDLRMEKERKRRRRKGCGSVGRSLGLTAE